MKRHFATKSPRHQGLVAFLGALVSWWQKHSRDSKRILMTTFFRYTLILLMTVHANTLLAQDCTIVERTKVKNKETESYGKIFESNDHYSFMIEKTLDKLDRSKPSKYSFWLVAAARVNLTDSVLMTKGTFELHLRDSSVITVNNVVYQNNPIPVGPCLGFLAEVDEEIIKLLSTNPIVAIKVNEVDLTTMFAEKKQKQMQLLCGCLLIQALKKKT